MTSNGDSNGDGNSLTIVKEIISQGLKISYKESSKMIIELCKDWISEQEIALRLGYSAGLVVDARAVRPYLALMERVEDFGDKPVCFFYTHMEASLPFGGGLIVNLPSGAFIFNWVVALTSWGASLLSLVFWG